MPRIDKLLKEMASRSASRTRLIADQSTQVEIQGREIAGPVLSRAQIEQLVLEIAPTHLHQTLFTSRSSQSFLYHSPHGEFRIRAFVGAAVFMVLVAPEVPVDDVHFDPGLLIPTTKIDTATAVEAAHRSGVAGTCGLAGSILLGAGIFAPVLSAPLLGGDVSYLQIATALTSPVLPTGLGVVALLSFILVLSRSYKALWLMGLGALAAVGFSLTSLLWVFQSVFEASQSSANPASPLYQQFMGAITPHLEWGWGLLLAGPLLLLVAAAHSPASVSSSKPKSELAEFVEITVALGGLAGFALLWGLNNTIRIGLPPSFDNAVRFLPYLGQGKIDNHDAYIAVQRFVREKLPTGAQAKFPNYDDPNVSVQSSGGQQWRISGYVKYPVNGAGQMARQNWRATMRFNLQSYSWEADARLEQAAPPADAEQTSDLGGIPF